MTVNDRTASSRQLAARWSTATGVLSRFRQFVDVCDMWIACKGALYRIPFTENHPRLSLQWAHEHRAWQADWHQVVFTDESRFNL